jgi:hypothetical protein
VLEELLEQAIGQVIDIGISRREPGSSSSGADKNICFFSLNIRERPKGTFCTSYGGHFVRDWNDLHVPEDKGWYVREKGHCILLVLGHKRTSKIGTVTGRNGDKIVVWTNAVVDARYSLSVPEQRLILWLARSPSPKI